MQRRAFIRYPLAAAMARATRATLYADGTPAKALVLSTRTVEAYEESEAALTETLRQGGCETARAEAGGEWRGQGGASDVIVAIGLGALQEAASAPGPPLAAATSLRSHIEAAAAEVDPKRPLAAVALDIDPSDLARHVRRVFPEARSLGVLRRAGQGPPARAIDAAFAAAGLTPRLAECGGPADLLDAFLSLRQQAEAVWCPADDTLYSSATVKPLILASLKTRLAVVGFSAGIVRAGAALGVAPDYQSIGRRAGELVLAGLRTAGLRSIEDCPLQKVTLNRRVLRILGLKHAAPETIPGVEIVG